MSEFTDGKVIRGLTKSQLREWWDKIQSVPNLSGQDQRILNKIEEKIDSALGKYGEEHYAIISRSLAAARKPDANHNLINTAANVAIAELLNKLGHEPQDSPVILVGNEVTFVTTKHDALTDLPGDRESRARWRDIHNAIESMPGVKLVDKHVWVEGDPKPKNLMEDEAVESAVVELNRASAR